MANKHLSNAVIIYGSVRSGTTMFRLMLRGHPDLVEIGEQRYLTLYSNFQKDGTLTFDHRNLAVDRVFAKRGFDTKPGLDGVALVDDLVGQRMAGRTGAPVITFHTELPKILRIFPDCRVLHIVRDPRDVSASVMRLGWAGNAYYAASNWLTAEKDMEAARRQLKPGQLLSLKYEKLATNPEPELRKICDFLGISFDPRLFGYVYNTTYDSPNQSAIGGWRKKLSDKEIELIEQHCSDLMEERGYQRITQTTAPLSQSQINYLKWHNRLNKFRTDIGTFGAMNVIGAQVGSKLGLLGMRDHFNRRIHKITNANLK